MRPDARWIPRFCRLGEATCASIVFTPAARVLRRAQLAARPDLLRHPARRRAPAGALDDAVACGIAWLAASLLVTVGLGAYLTWSLLFVIRVACALCFASHAINAAILRPAGRRKPVGRRPLGVGAAERAKESFGADSWRSLPTRRSGRAAGTRGRRAPSQGGRLEPREAPMSEQQWYVAPHGNQIGPIPSLRGRIDAAQRQHRRRDPRVRRGVERLDRASAKSPQLADALAPAAGQRSVPSPPGRTVARDRLPHRGHGDAVRRGDPRPRRERRGRGRGHDVHDVRDPHGDRLRRRAASAGSRASSGRFSAPASACSPARACS